MARPEKRDVDYFPFYVKDGKTLFILESKYGCEGTGFFTNVMRFLCQTPDHHFCIQDSADRLYFFAKTKCDANKGTDMLDIMAKTGKIHSHLWVSGAVIVSEALLDSIKDAYRKRNNRIITLDEITKKYVSAGDNDITGADNGIKGADNTQSKVKESKVKKTTRGKSGFDFIFPDWMEPFEFQWKQFLLHRKTIKKPISEYGKHLAIKSIERLKNKGFSPDHVINTCIEKGWQGIYEPKEEDPDGMARLRAKYQKPISVV